MATKKTTTKKAAAPKATKSTKAASKKSASAKAKPTETTAATAHRESDPDATKSVETTRTKKTAAKPTAAKPKKVSAIDAAAQVLAASKEPLNAQQLIGAMTAQGLWTSPGGKTPHATLYSAILREINTKGSDARFIKTERGKFAAKV